MKADYIILGHSSHVNGVTFSKDGSKLYSFGFSGELKVWNSSDWSHLQDLNGHSKSVNGLLELENSLMSGALDGKLNVYEKESGKLIKTYEDHKKGINGLKLSDDEQFILSYGEKRMAVLRNAEGEILNELKADARHQSVKVISPDNSYILIAGVGNKIRKFSLPDFDLLKEMEIGQVAINRVIETKNQLWILDYSGEVFQVDAQSWELKKQYRLNRKGVMGMCYAPTRNELAITADKAVIILDAESLEEKQLLTSEAKGNYGLSWSPDEKTLALASADKRIRIWEL
ncbi:MAG: hypothetical protein R8P61_07190 [Bacteroidia bacterium]|nr:hypothetical protein [Bacteroidia bacterium]